MLQQGRESKGAYLCESVICGVGGHQARRLLIAAMSVALEKRRAELSRTQTTYGVETTLYHF